MLVPPGASAQDSDLFRMLVDRVQDYAIFLLSPSGHVASWNMGAARVKGYTADEIIGQSFERFYTPEDRARGRPAFLLSRATAEGHVEDEGWRVRKDGTPFWANVVITALFDERHRLVGFAKVTRDLTQRREQEQERARRLAAERSAERFSRLQKSTAALSATTRPADAAEVLLDLAVGMLDADGGLVAFTSREQQVLEVIRSRGYSAVPERLGRGQTVGLESSHPLARVYRAREALFLASSEQIRAEDAEVMPLDPEGSAFCAWAILPLMVEEQLVGVWAAGFRSPQPFEVEQRGFLLALSDVAAQAAIRNVRVEFREMHLDQIAVVVRRIFGQTFRV